MPDHNAQHLTEPDTFADMITDQRDALNLLYEDVSKVVFGTVALKDAPTYLMQSLRAVELLYKPKVGG
jgi:hypothetical protein